jgi:septum formation protein
MSIYLASRSPRRRELLAQIGVRFEPLLFREGARADPDTDESVKPGESADDYVRRVTRMKAGAAWKLVTLRRGLTRKPVLAADTTVALGDEIFAKPADAADAARMLAALSGKTHRVLTAVGVQLEGRFEMAVSESRVTFVELDAARIAAYVASGEPFDKAGAYGIQGLGTLLVEEVAGNYPNVVGLPVPAVGRLFAELGYDLLDFRTDGGERAAGGGAAGAAALPRTALSQGPTASFPELAVRYLGEYEAKIRFAVARLSEDEIWWRPHPRANSVGNLLLHLAGNLTQWVVGGIGGAVEGGADPRAPAGGRPVERDRAGEFAADRSAGRAELLFRLGEAVARAQAVLGGLTDAGLARPLRIQSYDATVLAAAFHAVEHLSYHTGQILAVAKELAGDREPFELYPQHRGE